MNVAPWILSLSQEQQMTFFVREEYPNIRTGLSSYLLETEISKLILAEGVYIYSTTIKILLAFESLAK